MLKPALALALTLATLGASCVREVKVARTSASEPVSEAELDSQERLAHKRCGFGWAFVPVVLGLGQYCHRKDGEAAALAIAGAIELGTAVAVARRQYDPNNEESLNHPGVGIPLVAWQDAYVAGLSDAFIDRARAEHLLYAPTDSLVDLVAAPFNWEVMKRPKVWLGLAGVLAVGIVASLAVEPTNVAEPPRSERVNLFGRDFSQGVGYPLGTLAGIGLFTHVATAEELLFRGVLQSALPRRIGETPGWLLSSVIFGVAHAGNAAGLPPEERKAYLMIGLPVITAAGSYLGYLYKDSGYSLAPPTAVHFWYDLLLTSTFFAIDPKNSPFAAKLRFRF
jgi:membrane protease YdiL (CAAX protease family)